MSTITDRIRSVVSEVVRNNISVHERWISDQYLLYSVRQIQITSLLLNQFELCFILILLQRGKLNFKRCLYPLLKVYY